MKYFIPSVLLFFISPTIDAQQKDSVFASSTLMHATVYYGYGAELQHQSKVQLGNGYQEVIINDLALQVDENTVQITCPENVTILSYYHRSFTKPATPGARTSDVKAMDSIKVLQKQVAAISHEYSTNEDMLKRLTILIENNFSHDKQKDISSAELIKLAEYYASKVKTIKETLYGLQLKKTDLTEKIDEINKRVNEYIASAKPGSESKPMGQLIMQVLTKNAATIEFGIAYFTRNAGWVPTYDLRMKTLDNTLKFGYKASVSQSTGLDWIKVKLSLSTTNPNQGTIVPVLNANYVQLYAPEVYKEALRARYARDNNLSGKVEGIGVTTHEDKAVASSLSQVGPDEFTTLRESQLNTNFEIDLPYDIISNGRSQSVSIKEEIVPAVFNHFAKPKLDKDAFLVARISSWDSLNLMPGQANIIMDNVYLGRSYIDPNTTADTLDISLGRDKRIALKRVQVKEFTSTKVRGDSKTETHNFEITVKNNKKQVAELIVKDQYPVSKVKEVEVVLTEAGTAEKNPETGILEWNLKLQPGESKKLRFSYTVRYPKDKVLYTTN